MKSIRNKSILIVDDDEGMLRALDKVLTGEGAMVTSTKSADDAVEILVKNQNRFDLLITDLRMPFISGMTLLYAVQEIIPTLPFIVLTALGDFKLRAESLRLGASAFLEKPLETSQLLEEVQKIFHAKRPVNSTI